MARSFYKGEPLGKTPACLLCKGAGDGERARLHLTRGVSVWLCASHRDPGFLTSRAGRDLVVSLQRMWQAAGCLAGRRSQALDDHLRRVRAAHRARDLPGSYAWAALRVEAEGRFAQGEDPRRVIRELRDRHAHDHARAPSARTMRRWFTEGRWIAGGPTGAAARGSPRARHRRGEAARLGRVPGGDQILGLLRSRNTTSCHTP